MATRQKVELAVHFEKYLRMAIEDLYGVSDVFIDIYGIDRRFDESMGEQFTITFTPRMPKGYCVRCGNKIETGE